MSFDFNECKTKRRYLNDQKALQDFRPLYEEVFDGRFQINWQVGNARYFYIDADDNRLENQIPAMILELYKQCCDNEIADHLNYKKRILEYEREKKEQLAEELMYGHYGTAETLCSLWDDKKQFKK
ncbi:MAG: hypothetical protein WA125_08340 [Desulfosporosinus sp.]